MTRSSSSQLCKVIFFVSCWRIYTFVVPKTWVFSFDNFWKVCSCKWTFPFIELNGTRLVWFICFFLLIYGLPLVWFGDPFFLLFLFSRRLQVDFIYIIAEERSSRNKRRRVSANQTIINCDVYVNLDGNNNAMVMNYFYKNEHSICCFTCSKWFHILWCFCDSALVFFKDCRIFVHPW